MPNKRSFIFRHIFSLQAGFFLIFAFPASTNYQLKDFGFGTGGVGNATSTSYALDAISGEQSAGNLVIDLSGQNAPLAEEIASSIGGGTVGSTLPDDEIHPNTDVLIIVGNK